MIESEKRVFHTPVTVALVGSHYSGKTTLARLFSEKLNFVALEERWSGNPFLHSQQNNPLQNQIWYLQRATEAMLKAKELNKKGVSVVLDTFTYSVLIFSKIFLTEKDFEFFSESFDSQSSALSFPDLLVYLKADTDFLYYKRRALRIKDKTGPDTDSTVKYGWLEKSVQLHDALFMDWSFSPAIQVDIEEKNYLHK